ncbi:translocation and assembly module TamB [Polaromonas sp. CG_9.5]|uniref:translocation/assembly module TamB domain-containing protein n=1 Tax=Polaromonas sp. CG_9.5 TaxID=3071705 RepID=UPI002E0C5E0F|nr:translocation and assembly module TamB [Polaromonas sp. CG_9.5]
MATPSKPANTKAKRAAKPARSWLKASARVAGGLIALTVGATGALWWWAGTEGSLATGLQWASQSQPLKFENATGSLRAGGHVDQLNWEQDGLNADARDVTLSWQPWSLLHGTLKLNRLSAASIEVTDTRPPSPTPTLPPNALGLPLQIALDDFFVGQFEYKGKAAFTVADIAGNYAYNGLQHQFDLKSTQYASGLYSGRAVLTSTGPLTLQATLSGALAVTVPNNPEPVPLTFQATANGPLTDMQVKAELQMTAAATASAADAKKPALQPHASASARVTPWAAQPLPQAEATFRDLDLAALLPQAPQTLLSGSASVQPLENASPTAASPAWALQLQLTNSLPGPWDQQRLPVEQLDTQGEWRDGAALVRSLKAQLGGGELLASGEWAPAPPAAPPSVSPATAPATAEPTAPAQAWQLNATLKHINPAQLHTQLAPLPLDGRAEVNGQGAITRFDASVQTARGAANAVKRPAPRTHSGQNNLLEQLRLRDASATGSWNAQQAGGTLTLSALQVRTSDAELSGQLEVQPAQKGGQGKLALSAPGLEAKLNGEMRPTSGAGELSVRGRDAAQALRWLQKLPGMPASVLSASASGSAELQAQWKGGWQDPALQAKLDVPSLDWIPAASKAPAPKKPAANTPAKAVTAPKAAASANLLKVRELQATLSGRLTQAQLGVQGRVEIDQRRYALQVAVDGGRLKPANTNTPLGESAWKGLVKQLSLSVEDPALGSGAWRLATRAPVALKWTPSRTGGAFESGSGEALLTAPASTASSTPPSQATLSWQPVRWRAGELVTAGKITGLPIAWVELLAGPQMKGAGLGGTLVFEGQWDAVLNNSLKVKASLARSSGDITVEAPGVPGNATRVAAGIKEARISLETAGDALTLALRWNSERAGTADGQLKTRLVRAPDGQGVGGWLWPADAPLNGQLRAQLPRIGVWSLLAPPGWRLRGSLGADVTISGTRAAPNLAGDLQANDLALRSVVDGIEFGNGRLRARLDGTRMRINEFTLQGAGEKGTGGSLTAQGEAGWINGKPQVQLDAKLQQLRASIRTDRQLTVSGDVQARLQGDQTELTGKLVIDKARIILPDEGTPQLGDDVIVRTASGAAAGKKAPEKTSNETVDKANRPLKLAVDIDLGRDFRIQGKGIDTRIRGTLALSGNSLSEPRLVGTLRTFGGQYRAYGQRLDVEQGVIRFTGAIDNPTLDILAIRPNLTQRVGVQITGTALLPSVRLYAQPELPDAEKLSWLIVGRPSAAGGAEAALLQQAALALLGSKGGGMSGGLAASLGLDELSFRGSSNNADGTATGGAITLGKRFSRNFYAAYERSISGALGTLFVFYDLSQRFTLRAQAGEQSAIDLIFTVPYD